MVLCRFNSLTLLGFILLTLYFDDPFETSDAFDLKDIRNDLRLRWRSARDIPRTGWSVSSAVQVMTSS